MSYLSFFIFEFLNRISTNYEWTKIYNVSSFFGISNVLCANVEQMWRVNAACFTFPVKPVWCFTKYSDSWLFLMQCFNLLNGWNVQETLCYSWFSTVYDAINSWRPYCCLWNKYEDLHYTLWFFSHFFFKYMIPGTSALS